MNTKGFFKIGNIYGFQKGYTSWNKGLTNSMETREKISIANRGKTRSLESKIRYSLSKMGNKNPAKRLEVRQKMSESQKGRTPWNKGKKLHYVIWNKGTKGIMKGNSGTFKPGEKQRLLSLSNRQKMSRSSEPTSIERKLYEELKTRGFLFETQKIINGRFLVDAYIPSLNLVIEADGDYWHGLERVIKKDRAENAYLAKCGFKLLRISETEINDGSFKERLNIN